MVAGLTDVEGPGVSVILNDSKAENTTGDEADYLIHDSDLLSVINELRDAGAQAISFNGERILATSEVRCAGSVVMVNGKRFAAPFIIYAIGDPDYPLQRADHAGRRGGCARPVEDRRHGADE